MTARPVVYVVSDSVGETADLVTRAAISQFDGGNVADIRRFPMVETAEDLEHILTAARQQPSIIVYTLIMPEIRRLMGDRVAAYGLPAVDIMGPMLDALTQVLGSAPKLQPGLVRQLDEEYFRRVEAVEFAVRYDDGKDPRGCLKADLVLLGVSRTSKTPVSMYLAHRRVKVCNIPLVPEVALPPELFQVPEKAVGLIVEPQKLLQIREERLRIMGLPSDANYANMPRILQELEYARDIYRKLGCPVVDVTNRAVEETAIRVLEHIGKGAKFSD